MNLVAKTTLTLNLTRASPFLVLFSRTWETPDVQHTLQDLAHFPDQRASSIDTTRESQGKMQ